jgi:ABC-type antimicrobial peptide transport system ATPase subunit
VSSPITIITGNQGAGKSTRAKKIIGNRKVVMMDWNPLSFHHCISKDTEVVFFDDVHVRSKSILLTQIRLLSSKATININDRGTLLERPMPDIIIASQYLTAGDLKLLLSTTNILLIEV